MDEEELDSGEEIAALIEHVDEMTGALKQLNLIIISIILTLKREGIEIERLPSGDSLQ